MCVMSSMNTINERLTESHNVFIFIGVFKNDKFSSEARKLYADAGAPTNIDFDDTRKIVENYSFLFTSRGWKLIRFFSFRFISLTDIRQKIKLRKGSFNHSPSLHSHLCLLNDLWKNIKVIKETTKEKHLNKANGFGYSFNGSYLLYGTVSMP